MPNTVSPETMARAIAKIAAAPRPTAAQILHTRQQIAASKRPGGELRGSAKDRRARTAKLLAEFGNGETCECVYCGTELTAATLQQDKLVPGSDGGRYVFANLVPSCGRCNLKRSDTAIHEYIAECEASIEYAKTFLRSA